VGIRWLDAGLDSDARLDGDAGTEDASIDGDDVPIHGTCTGEGGIHAAIVGDGDGGIHACGWVPWDDGRTNGVAGIAAGGGIDACDRMVRVDGTLDELAVIGGDGGIQAWDLVMGVAACISCAEGPGRLIGADCEGAGN